MHLLESSKLELYGLCLRFVLKRLLAYFELLIIPHAPYFVGSCTNIDNNFFDSMVNRIYPSELQLNKANVSDAEASFLDLHLSISDGFVKTKIYDK